MEMKLEVVVVPVSDFDRSKQFYERLGWRFDAEFADGADYHLAQFTPPGSGASVIIGKGVTDSAPGSLQGLYLVVPDIEAARAELSSRGVAVSEIFHDETGVFNHAGVNKRIPGPDPKRESYESFAAFSDPDGNGWFLQEVTERRPGR